MLDLRYINPQTDDAAIRGPAFFDQDTATVGQNLLVRPVRIFQSPHALGDPLFLAADRVGVVAALHTNAQGVFESRAGIEQVSASFVDIGVLLIPENVASLGVEEDKTVRKNVDCLAEPGMRPLRLSDCGVGVATRT